MFKTSAQRTMDMTEGPLAGSTVPLSPSSIIIGRSPSSTLVLDDSYASSRHARVFPKDGSWWLEDLGSTNGTILMRPSEPPRRLTQHQRALLRTGDVIDLGDGVSVLVEA